MNSGSSVLVRKASTSDLEALEKLAAHSHELYRQFLPHFLQEISLLHWRERFRKTLSMPDFVVFVAERKGRVVGYAELIKRLTESPLVRPKTRLILDNIVVAENQRGQGIAPKLLTEIEKFAHNSGVELIELQVSPLNEAALALYEKFGYTERFRTLEKKIDSISHQ